jgi:hypothetical protein
LLHLLPWLFFATAVAGVCWMGRKYLQHLEAEHKRQDEIRERADQQLRWYLSGDERATYGAEGAKLRWMC